MEFVVDFLIQSGLLLAYSLAFIFIGGFIISLIEDKSNYYLQKAMGYTGIIITGLGTVVHELSHLIFAIIGGMKIGEVKLFRPIKGRVDGVLGYVSFSPRGRNLYNKIFLIPVGIAPIIGGTVVILISLKICLPSVFQSFVGSVGELSNTINIVSFDFLTNQLSLISKFFSELFSASNILTINFWIFMFIVLSIASHMSLSSADIKGCIKGIPGLFILIVVVNCILALFGNGIDTTANYITIGNVYIVVFLSISILFSILNLIISFGISKIFGIIKG